MDKIKEQKNKEESLKFIKDNFDDLVSEFTEDPDKLDELSPDQLLEFNKHMNVYNNTIESTDGTERYTCLSYTNLREQYLQQYLTTSLIGYTFRSCDEYEVDELDLEVELNKDDFKRTAPNQDMSDEKFVDVIKSRYYTKFKRQFLEEEFNYTDSPRIAELESLTIDGDKQVEGHEEEKKELRELYLSETQKIREYELSQEQEEHINSLIEAQLSEDYPATEYVDNQAFLNHKEQVIKEQSEKEREIIQRFLDSMFVYNPDIHVRNSHITKRAASDKTRDPIAPSTKPVSDMDTKQLCETKVPPQDLFYKLERYKSANYEVLRKCVTDIYGTVPDLEITFNVYDSFKTLTEAEKYVDDHKKSVIADIHTIQNNKWVFVGSFKENRDRIDHYNENTDIMKNIMKQMEDDTMLGSELLKEKVKYKKVKNVKDVGPDHPDFLKYKKEYSNTSTGSDSKNDTVENPDGTLTVTEEVLVDSTGKPVKVDEDGTPVTDLEVDVFHVNAAEGEMSKSRFFTTAKQPGTK